VRFTACRRRVAPLVVSLGDFYAVARSHSFASGH
jgi:hypothetical protein